MSKFFKDHYEKLLIAFGVLFLVIVTLAFLWSVSFLSNIFSNVFSPDNNNQAIRFDIEGAKRLNLNIGS